MQMMVGHHVNPEDLQAYVLDAEPLEATAIQHLNRCDCCQHQLAEARRTGAALLSTFYRHTCPSALTLSYYCLPDGLSAEEQRQVSEHLVICPLCQREIAETRQFLGTTH